MMTTIMNNNRKIGSKIHCIIFTNYNTMSGELEELEELDFSWLDEFENTELNYQHYYLEDNHSVRINLVYLNSLCEIVKMKQEKVMLQSVNLLSKEELIQLINHHSFLHEKKYKVFSILKFNLDLEPRHLHNFLKKTKTKVTTNDNELGSQYLHVIHKIATIQFNKTIGLFQDLNEIVLFFEEDIGSDKELDIKKKRKFTKRAIQKWLKHRKTKRTH